MRADLLTLVLFADFGFPPPENLSTTAGIVRGVVVTLVVELAIVAWHARRRQLPPGRLLAACLIGNCLTLPAVWFCSVIAWFFLAYLGVVVFLLVELGAAIVEGGLFALVGRLDRKSAIRLGLLVNAVTAGLGIVDQALHVREKPGPPPGLKTPASVCVDTNAQQGGAGGGKQQGTSFG